MIILGIESSCDETSIAIVKDGREVLSNVINSQIEEHKSYGGVVPEIASRRHTENIVTVAEKAFELANMKFEDIDAIAVTYAPGLVGALLVGVSFAKGLAFSLNKPLIPVHHLRGHIASNYITNKELEPPFICLVVSGGHSHIVDVKDYTHMKIIGRTLDDAAGEVFDKVARNIGLDYPGGVKLDKVADYGDDSAFNFPHPKTERPFDFSFSGLKTNAINKIHNITQKGGEIPVEDISASFRKAVVDCLCDRFMKAIEFTGYKNVVIAGGVSANSLLRSRLKEICKKNKLQLFMPELKLCGDNGAMIASQGYFEFLGNNIADLSLNAYATMSIENIRF